MFNRWKEELYLGQQQLARAISAASHGFVGAIRAAVNPPAEKVKPDLEEPFVPDGVFGGIPYRVLPSGSIDAMMPGGMVRFRNMDQLLAAADRNQTLSSVPRTEPKKPLNQIDPARGSNWLRTSRRLGIAISVLAMLFLAAVFTAPNRPDTAVSPLTSSTQYTIVLPEAASSTPALAPKPTTRGPCQHPDDLAADGSRCGERASSARQSLQADSQWTRLWAILKEWMQDSSADPATPVPTPEVTPTPVATAPPPVPVPAPTSTWAPAPTAPTSSGQMATGRCQNPDDRAADGSRCGRRASSERKGGR
jgi:hypothetical protein